MNIERLQGWMSFLANVAVLAGIVFLGVEINQNTRAVVAASSTALTDQSVAFVAAGLDNDVVARALYKQEVGEGLDPRARSRARPLERHRRRCHPSR